MRRRAQKHFDPEHGSLAYRAIDADDSAHQLDQPLGHHQADACTFLDAGLFPEAVERLEQLHNLFRGKSLAGVPDADANRVRRTHHAVHDDGTVGFVIFDRVEKKIDQNLLYPGSVGKDEIRGVKARKCHADAALLRLWLDHRLAFEHDLVQ